MTSHDIDGEARSLVAEYGLAAIEIARNRAEQAQRNGVMRAHDHALLVLNAVEKLLRD